MEKGKEVEKELEKYFISKKIPYHRNVRVCYKRNQCEILDDGTKTDGRSIAEFDFIIKDAVIECKYKLHIINYNEIEKQLYKLMIFCKSKQIYLFIKNLYPDSLEFYKKKFTLNPLFSQIKIINDPKEIIIEPIQTYEYFIPSRQILYSFIKNPEFHNKKTCWVSKHSYNSLISILKDDELSIMDDFTAFRILNATLLYYKSITNRSSQFLRWFYYLW